MRLLVVVALLTVAAGCGTVPTARQRVSPRVTRGSVVAGISLKAAELRLPTRQGFVIGGKTVPEAPFRGHSDGLLLMTLPEQSKGNPRR